MFVNWELSYKLGLSRYHAGCLCNLKELLVIFTSFHDINQKNKKRLFPKFQLILILRLQVIPDYVH